MVAAATEESMHFRAGTLLAATLLGAAALALWPGHAGATLLRASVHGRYLYPTTSNVFLDGGTQTITPTTVFDFTSQTRSALTAASFSDAQVIVTSTAAGLYAPAAFDGIDLAFLSGPAIADVVEDPSSSPLFASGSVLTFTVDDIMLNLAGTCAGCRGGEQIILDVTTGTAVPESTSLSLLGAGLLGLAAVRRRIA